MAKHVHDEYARLVRPPRPFRPPLVCRDPRQPRHQLALYRRFPRDPANPEESIWNSIRDLLISGLPEEGGSPPTTISLEAQSPVAIEAIRAGLAGCCDAEEDSGYGVRLRWENLLDGVKTPPQGLLDSIGDQFETSSLTEENKQKDT